jgi:crotonobetainyl-CoA:carnitine CoA-transferase CaiB-like acyl-CoA transferase
MTTPTDPSAGPLSGIKVLDLTLALAGPLCTQRLADMGADVVKIESPGRFDFTRGALMRDVRLGGESMCYLSVNRNKRSILIDLKTRDGQDLFRRMAAQADVVIQNMRPGAAERLGITFDALTEANPRIVYVSISGYGDEGPMVARPGQDLLVQAFSGTTFNAGTTDGLPHPAPIYVVDVAASHNACEAILAGIIQRDRFGVPVEAKVSLLAAVLEIQIQEITTHMTTGRTGLRGKAPYASTYMEPPYGIFPTADGHIAIAQSDLGLIAKVLGSDALADLASRRPDPDDVEALQVWRDAVYPLVAEALKDTETEDAVTRLDAAGVWCGPVQDYDGLIAHPQSRGLFVTIDHPRAGPIRTLAPPIRFSTQTAGPMTGAPAAGEHTRSVLQDYGLSPAEVEGLFSKGVVA